MPYYGTKRKVFISFFQGDRTHVDAFIEKWADQEGVFTPKSLGTSDNSDFINSTNPDYVMSKIRERYLQDSSVTIVLIGDCTHSRRYVDWEIKASLTQGESVPNGLLAILLPYKNGRGHLPPRFESNWNSEKTKCYAQFRHYPTTAQELGGWIEDAYLARTTKAHHIQNTQEMMKNNAKCLLHVITH